MKIIEYPSSKIYGRLRIMEKVGPVAEGKNAGMMRALCLCACGGTKVFLLLDVRTGRARHCEECERLSIKCPHRWNQEIIRYPPGVTKAHQTPERRLVQRGPPLWDPVTKKGYFPAEVLEDAAH